MIVGHFNNGVDGNAKLALEKASGSVKSTLRKSIHTPRLGGLGGTSRTRLGPVGGMERLVVVGTNANIVGDSVRLGIIQSDVMGTGQKHDTKEVYLL